MARSSVPAVGVVTRDSGSAKFFDGTRRGVFLLGRRQDGEYVDPRTLPGEEGLTYVPAAGQGRVISWATVHGRAADDGEASRTVVGIVELDEGPWWWCQLVGVDPDANLTNLKVQLDFVASGPEHEVVPVFRKAT